MSKGLVESVRQLLVDFDAAEQAEEQALEAVLGASQNAPTNAKGQFLDPQAVHDAGEPLRPAFEAASERRLELQQEIEDMAFEVARHLVELADKLTEATS